MNFDPQAQYFGTPSSWGNTEGGGLFISSNNENNAILWAFSQRGNLFAFDASKDISAGPIWTASQNGPSSWGWPTVVNGRLYAPGGGKIYVYGLKNKT